MTKFEVFFNQMTSFDVKMALREQYYMLQTKIKLIEMSSLTINKLAFVINLAVNLDTKVSPFEIRFG